jgi:hypothetical protein
MHISYLLQNCKKGKSGEMDLPSLKNDITGSELTVKILDTLQKHAIQPQELGWMISQVF